MTRASAGGSPSLALEHERPAERAAPLERGMAVGFLAMSPLIAAYEASIAQGTPIRNSAQVLLSLPLAPLGELADPARRCALALCFLWAAWSSFHAELGLVRRVWRVILEGALFAAVIGPLLVLLLKALDVAGVAPALSTPPQSAPRIAAAALVCGGAAYEEIVFRVGIQSLFYLLARRVLERLAAPRAVASVASELGAIAASAAVFAAMHLALFTAPLGPGGEAFDGAIFTWRVLSGILLSGIFRWRGPGVAAWTHALFNLALFLGAGPSCFL
jgi:hypothetical protein